jgi:hypothetical protein
MISDEKASDTGIKAFAYKPIVNLIWQKPSEKCWMRPRGLLMISFGMRKNPDCYENSKILDV